jgi:hypothetical protein
VAKEILEVPSEIAALPDLEGLGAVCDFHQLSARDSSAQLSALIKTLAALEGAALCLSMCGNIMIGHQ